MVPFQKVEVGNLTSLTDLGSKYVLSGSHTCTQRFYGSMDFVRDNPGH